MPERISKRQTRRMCEKNVNTGFLYISRKNIDKYECIDNIYRGLAIMDPILNYDPDAESMPEPALICVDYEFPEALRKKTTESIDKLTMELLVNKKHYKKMVEKTDPAKHAQLEQQVKNIRKYKREILNLVEELVENPAKQVTNDINDTFDAFLNIAIRYFQMKDLEKNPAYIQDDDVMFDFDNYTQEVEPEKTEPSLWGEERVLKKTKGLYPLPIAFPRTRK